jgi:CheY-like chemotaxis protein
MRPSAIMRSISRREAIPARASNFAMRWGPSSRATGWLPRAEDAGRRFLSGRCGTGRRFVRCGGEVIVGVVMLFGKRSQVVKRILIVEDEPLTAFDNENMLGDAGYEIVATVDDFSEAVEIIGREEVHLILSDIRLRSTETGIDLAHKAKALGIPTLFATGHAHPDCGVAVGCLNKPYTERQLCKAIECVDQHLQGEKVKPPRGLQLFVAPAPEDEG